jgi:hypothetical protein
MDSVSRFEETELPPVNAFYNQLNEQNCSDTDYEHAQKVWKVFNMKTMRDYHNLYLKADVLQLTDVFESFRNFAIDKFSLDPAHYITVPSYTWDACLKFTKVELDLLSDPDMYRFFEQGIRGGVSVISGRYAKANNPLCPDYDPWQENEWIMYLDANNLYGWSMSEQLPVGKFRWLDDEEIDRLDITQIADVGDTGYVLEVDLEYPENIHDAHNDYPLAPERLEITDDMLSPYSKKLLTKPRGKVEKLAPNLYSKNKYVIHYRNLKYYIA